MKTISDILGMVPQPVQLVLLGIGLVCVARQVLGGLSLLSSNVLGGRNV